MTNDQLTEYIINLRSSINEISLIDLLTIYDFLISERDRLRETTHHNELLLEVYACIIDIKQTMSSMVLSLPVQ